MEIQSTSMDIYRNSPTLTLHSQQMNPGISAIPLTGHVDKKRFPPLPCLYSPGLGKLGYPVSSSKSSLQQQVGNTTAK